MKKIYFVLVFAFLFLMSSTQAQIYVKADASGANDGSSWTDAFSDLTDAINSSSPGDQLWVAAGTYKPGGATPDSTSTFSFPHDLELYGGFVGTETMLTERDWENNETILSGDHMGNDVNDTFGATREDNSLHVMFLTDTVSTSSIIDGLTIRNGNTEDGSGTADLRRAGGILTYGAPTIRNCYFTQNYGWFGGGLYPRGTADTMTVDNCVFENNRAGWGGGGVYNLGAESTFSNCTFTNNQALTVLAGGLYNGVDGVTVSNCEFNTNVAVASRGGGMYTAGNSTIVDCLFNGNQAASSTGGGLQVRSGNDPGEPPVVVDITRCIFQGNEANWGGALGVYDAATTANVTDCEFIDNEANAQGGASTNAFGATTNFTNTLFRLNESDNSAGAIFSQNDSATITIIDCTISENGATTIGGALNMGSDGSANFGTTTPRSTLIIENTLFSNNVADGQGGAINLTDADLTLTNSIFEYNFLLDSDAGIGGAISLNTTDSLNSEPQFILTNNTIVNNTGVVGAGISNWLATDALETSNLILQNNIFYNPDGDNYIIEPGFGIPTATSSGGNLSTDLSLDTIFIGTNDLNATLPLFVDFDNDDYHLQDGSPCVDAGILAGAPVLDYEGNPRVDDVDMGAFENQKTVGVQDLENSFGLLTIFPNPIEDNLNFAFESLINGDLKISITNMEGKVVFTRDVEKTGKKMTRNYNVTKLTTGMYNLTITNGKYTNTQSFMKIK